jgi:uncharacterized protein (TIGR00369 family)
VDTEVDTEQRRTALRRHWEERIPFNVLCGFRVTRWDADGVTMEVGYEERLGNSQGSLHGGVLATLVDTAANGAVAAGDDYTAGSSMATVDLSMQYVAAVRDRVIVHATCSRRGRQLTFVDVMAVGPDGELVARGLVTVRVAHRDR